MTPEQAKEILLNQYLYYGVMMVKMGDADGMVSGACHSTADTLRPCLQILKTKPGTKLVSAFFLIIVPDCEYGAKGAFVFGDSGLNQNPNPEELAAIAGSSAESFKLLVQEEPIVAMLSHSTKGSAKHADVDKVVEATKIAKEQYPELALDGEFQLDAAIVPSVGASKAPGSPVAEKQGYGGRSAASDAPVLQQLQRQGALSGHFGRGWQVLPRQRLHGALLGIPFPRGQSAAHVERSGKSYQTDPGAVRPGQVDELCLRPRPRLLPSGHGLSDREGIRCRNGGFSGGMVPRKTGERPPQTGKGSVLLRSGARARIQPQPLLRAVARHTGRVEQKYRSV